MSVQNPAYSLQNTYSGVSVNSTSGLTTIQSSAAAGSATLVAKYGSLTATAALTLTKTGNANTYSLDFYYDGWPCNCYYYIDYTTEYSVIINAKAKNNLGAFVTGPELLSIVYKADTGAENTSGEFTVDELELDPWGYPGKYEAYITATATFSDGTVLQKVACVEALVIPPDIRY
jgi:hypothetical protein